METLGKKRGRPDNLNHRKLTDTYFHISPHFLHWPSAAGQFGKMCRDGILEDVPPLAWKACAGRE